MEKYERITALTKEIGLLSQKLAEYDYIINYAKSNPNSSAEDLNRKAIQQYKGARTITELKLKKLKRKLDEIIEINYSQMQADLLTAKKSLLRIESMISDAWTNFCQNPNDESKARYFQLCSEKKHAESSITYLESMIQSLESTNRIRKITTYMQIGE